MERQTFAWSQQRVFVTGASGFVGSWLVKALLERKAEITVLIRDLDDHSELVRSGAIHHVSIVNGCLEDFACLERAINEHETNVVFHLAAQALVGAALRSPLATFESNIRGTYNLLEACRAQSSLVKRVVVASSDKAYGEAQTLPYVETHPLAGRHPYDVSKSCTDLLAATYYATYRLPVAIARCGNIYGGGDLNWSRIVPGTIRSLLKGERPVLRSDGSFVRDYIYVEDAVHAYLSLAESVSEAEVQGEAFNFSNESPVTVRQIVQALAELMEATDLPPIVLGTAAQEIPSQSLSAEKARRTLGWQAEHSLDEGLRKTIDWYTRYLEADLTGGNRGNGADKNRRKQRQQRAA
jgi:CDP-glucose 4,6-dehydratase